MRRAPVGLPQVNRLVDGIFIIDLILQFFLMYQTSSDSEAGARWVDSPKQIVKHYLKGWFALDLFSILLMTIDFITITSSGGGGDSCGSDQEVEVRDDEESSLTALRVLRVLRALRLIKLVRLVRSSRMFTRWQARAQHEHLHTACVWRVCGCGWSSGGGQVEGRVCRLTALLCSRASGRPRSRSPPSLSP